MTEVLSVAILGLGLGAMYTLAAQGLVLIYRGSGVLNFAQGAVGICAAYLWYELYQNQNWPYLAALIVALVAALIIGALIHLLLMRPLRQASPLARTMATVGLLLTLQSVIVIRYGTETVAVPSSLPTSVAKLFGVPLPADRLILLGLAVALSAVLWACYRFTPFGRATSAVAENQAAAAGVGLSPDMVASANWAIGSGLAALAAILVAPILALQVSSMTSLMLACLAGALVAKFRSFGVVLLASVGMGVAQTELIRWVSNPQLAGLSASLPFLIIIVVLAARGQAIPLRDFLLERLPAVGSGRVGPLRVLLGIGIAVGLIALLPPSWVDAFGSTYAFAVFMLTFVVLIGYTGQISLAQWGLAGFGAWVAGRLIAGHGVPLILGVFLGVVATVPVGVALALPALRTRGINLAIATLGLGTALEVMIFDNPQYTGGFNGTTVNLQVGGWSFGQAAHPDRYALVTLGFFVAIALVVANIRRGLVGRRMLAVRTNERAATALGIGVRSVKLHSFGVAAAIAAVGGILVSFGAGTIDYTQFTGFASVQYAGFAFFGGIGYILGPIQSAIFAPGTVGGQLANTIVPGWDVYLGLVGGLALLLVILLNQDGVVAQLEVQWDWLMRRLKFGSRRRARRGGVSRKETRRADALAGDSGPSRSEAVRRVLEVRDLTVRYGSVVAVENMSLTVRHGKVTGLIGPNGAGKTSLLDAITGFTPVASGSVLLDGRDISGDSAVRRARSGIGRSFQSLELFEDMTVLENIYAASDSRHWRYYLTDLIWPSKTRLGRDLSAVVEEFHLKEDLDTPAKSLSYGQRRLLAIARAVAARPSVLLLDEPAAGLSEVEMHEFSIVVRRLAMQWGMAVLLIEHDIEFVFATCDTLEVIDFGRKISSGAPNVVRNDEAVIAAYLGGGSGSSVVRRAV
jgi:ABC-type branched-subunit amino acid transport system ATPase component/branched-subunit amino acid ABC-type transport system permease component